jgi:glucokinase
MQIYEQVGFYLGISISNTICTIAPDRIVIGGGGAQAGDLLLNPIRRTVKERVKLADPEKVTIVPADLGDMRCNRLCIMGVSAKRRINRIQL